jgi:hypothetical protein
MKERSIRSGGVDVVTNGTQCSSDLRNDTLPRIYPAGLSSRLASLIVQNDVRSAIEYKEEISASAARDAPVVGQLLCIISIMAPLLLVILLASSMVIAAASTAASTLDGSRFLWFKQPARLHYFEDAMPVGNGRIGATVYGGGPEVIGINENSIWTGPFQDRIANNPQAALAVTRKMLLAGNLSQARQYSMANMIPRTSSPRGFSYFGNINIDFGHKESDLKDYVRWLDTKEGTTGVSYTHAGIGYSSVAMHAINSNFGQIADENTSREYVASLPDGVFVASFNTSTAGALNMKISMSREGGITTTAAAKGGRYTVTLVGSSGQSTSDGPIRWTGQARFALNGGALFSCPDEGVRKSNLH